MPYPLGDFLRSEDFVISIFQIVVSHQFLNIYAVKYVWHFCQTPDELYI